MRFISDRCSLPEPWEEYHHDTRRAASSGIKEFRDGWEIKCWAKLSHGQTTESLEQKLFNALIGVEWVAEDISELKSERARIRKIREGHATMFGDKNGG